MSESADNVLRGALIARLKAQPVSALVGGRISDRAPNPDSAANRPWLVVRVSSRNDDTKTERARQHDVRVHVEGDSESDAQGFKILRGVVEAWRGFEDGSWSPALSGHVLTNLILGFEGVEPEEGGRSYAGLQEWRAATEET